MTNRRSDLRNLIILIVTLVSTPGWSLESVKGSFAIVTPYAGTVSSSYSNPKYNLNLNDSGLMAGVYAQWIKPELLQTNLFLYTAPSVGPSKILGAHLNGDFYPYHFSFAKAVVGLDVEALKINVATSSASLTSLQLDNKVAFIMPRAGLSFPLGVGPISITFFPYVGMVYEDVAGDLTMVSRRRAASPRAVSFSSRETYASAGANVSLRLMYFSELQLKYLTGLSAADQFSSITVMVNGYFTRNTGLSYRYTSMNRPNGSDRYHLAGFIIIL